MKHLFSSALALVVASFAGFAQCDADHVVEASSFMYAPSMLTIEQGESVAFVNLGGTHDVNGDVDSQTGMSFGNPEAFYLDPVSGAPEGECIGTYTFNVPGTYNYDCSIGTHAALGMVASIVVNPAPPTNTILDVIQNSPEHTLLSAAVDAAGLAGALSVTDTLTVFAPTDSAITVLVETLQITPADLLASETLGDILKYHVVAGLAMSSDLSNGQMIATLLGPDVTVIINEEGVFINNAQVTVADIMADNGVVHVIDAVLLPPTDSVEEAKASVQLMPNPATDVVRIGGLQGNASVVIRDLAGRVVFHNDNAGQLFNISHLGAGTYVVSVTQEGMTATTKLVVR